MTPPLPNRPNISNDLCHIIRQDIMSGSLKPASRINEVHLADKLSVSRTPLREALSSLTAEGLLDWAPRRGFFVKPLSIEEVQQLYPLRPMLDAQALRMAGIPDRASITELRQINRRMTVPGKKAIEVVDLDNDWHRLLLAHCPNRILIGFIEHVIRLTRRYEYAWLGEMNGVDTATGEHEAILTALEQEDLPEACNLLRKNLTTAQSPIIEWLQQREAES
ncbi:GntR family transcriptional regulator [Pseudomonadota bacterium]